MINQYSTELNDQLTKAKDKEEEAEIRKRAAEEDLKEYQEVT